MVGRESAQMICRSVAHRLRVSDRWGGLGCRLVRIGRIRGRQSQLMGGGIRGREQLGACSSGLEKSVLIAQRSSGG